jgi:hypothetical protein
MSVQPESLEVLEKADVPPAQARAIVRAIEIEIVGAKDTLATKHDILVLGQATKHDILVLRQEMVGLRADLEGRIVELGAALRGEMAKLATALHGEMAELRATLRGEMSDLRGELRAEIHRSVSGVTRQMYTALLGQMAVLLGFAYFFATNIA